MMRALIITAAASFVLAIACFAGAAALGGRELLENGWTVLPTEIWADNENVHISIGEELDPDDIPDIEPPATTTPPATNEEATAL
jgi:hypothetical protein